MIFEVLLITAIPMHVCAYKILMIPLPGKSHVFSMAAMSEGLVNRGHKVTFVIGESYHLNLPELRNRTEISIVRYKDMINGEHVDYDSVIENVARSAIEAGGNILLLASTIWNMYVDFTHPY